VHAARHAHLLLDPQGTTRGTTLASMLHPSELSPGHDSEQSLTLHDPIPTICPCNRWTIYTELEKHRHILQCNSHFPYSEMKCERLRFPSVYQSRKKGLIHSHPTQLRISEKPSPSDLFDDMVIC